MGQKSNPTLIRLEKSNTHHKSCWYSDRFYSQLLHNHYNYYLYINKVFNKIKNTNHCFYAKLQHLHNQLFCLFPKKTMKKQIHSKNRYVPKKHIKQYDFSNSKSNTNLNLSLLLGLNKKLLEWNHVKLMQHKHNTITTHHQQKIQFLKWHILPNVTSPSFIQGNYSQGVWNGVDKNMLSLLGVMFFYGCLGVFSLGDSLVPGERAVAPKNITASLNKNVYYNKNYANVLSQTIENSEKPRTHHTPVRGAFAIGWPQCPEHNNAISKLPVYDIDLPSFKKTTITLIKCRYWQQSGEFLIQKISNGIQNRVRFPRLRKQILWDCRRSPWIKGIRVTLSGRSEMRSKKAQKARSRTFQWGQTELQVFSSLVQFSKQDCVTPFGIVGIKLWICYGISS